MQDAFANSDHENNSFARIVIFPNQGFTLTFSTRLFSYYGTPIELQPKTEIF